MRTQSLLLCAALSSLALGLNACGTRSAAGPAPAAAPPGTAQQAASPRVLPHPALTRLGVSSVSIADVAERVTPSVVSVSASRVSHGAIGPFHFGPAPRDRREQGLGSGVIVKGGVVLTNNHVVEDADEIKVTTADNRDFDVEVVGTDPESDLAVLRLKGDTKDLKPIEIGDSSRLRLGDVVLAIGNPFGVGQTVTMGIVSAKGRADVGIVDYEDFIQTDAAINPGNSGGALVDMEGKLIGINTAILSRSGGFQGIGFAIPTNMARPILDSLLKSGRVVRGWLGVSIQNVDTELASAMHLGTQHGVLVSDVGAGTPADRGGLRRGDVVTKVDGLDVDSTGRLRNLIAARGAGVTVKLDVLRNGKPQRLSVRLGEMPNARQAARSAPAAGAPERSLDGMSLESLSAENRRRFRIPNDVPAGAVVSDVDRKSPAARAGMRRGDVVLEMNGTRITGADDFAKIWNRSRGRILLLVFRDGSTMFVVVNR